MMVFTSLTLMPIPNATVEQHTALKVTSRRVGEVVGQGSKHDLLCIGSQWIVKCRSVEFVGQVVALRDYLENQSLCCRQLLLQYFDPSLVSTLNDPLICCEVCAGRSFTQVKFSPDITGVCKYVHIIYMYRSVPHIRAPSRISPPYIFSQSSCTSIFISRIGPPTMAILPK